MAHFAKVINNIVTEVIVAEQDFINSGAVGDSFLWIQTSYTGSFRKNYAGIGYSYDQAKDAFIPPQPYGSWILNEDTCLWEAPVAKPSGAYLWNETNYQADNTTGWVEIVENLL